MKVVLQVGVKALLKNKYNKYLLVRRSLIKYPETIGRWGIVGGRIYPGVNLKENLKREVREETGLNIASEPKLIAAQDILNKPGRHVIRLTYLARADGEIKLDITENDMCRWLSLQEIKKARDIDIYFKEVLNKGIID